MHGGSGSTCARPKRGSAGGVRGGNENHLPGSQLHPSKKPGQSKHEGENWDKKTKERGGQFAEAQVPNKWSPEGGKENTGVRLNT